MNIADRYSKPPRMKRILIIQLGDIGDVVWSLPALQAVRVAYPDAEVAILLREGSGSLLAAGTLPPKIFEVRKKLGESFRLIRALRRERFGLVFDFRGDERGAYMAFLTGAPVRAAIYLPMLSGLRNRLFTHLVAPARFPMAVGAADSSLHLLQAFGIEARNAVPRLDLSDETKCRAEKILADEGIVAVFEPTAVGDPEACPAVAGETVRGTNGGSGPACGGEFSRIPSTDGNRGQVRPWMTVNPFSRWSYKEWGTGKWVRMIDWLREEFGITVVVVGSPAEKERAAELTGACSGSVCNLAGKTTLAELAGVLHLSRLHIGVDSAAPHIAAAVGTPTVTLYGPSDWRYWAPPGERHRVVVSDMECAPCNQKGCEGQGASRCLDALTVERVRAVVREILSV
ncbi:MAG: glycosyltransferase family 9 protein [Deltaproteobacteria bacterium]|nr:glycosyltransferase family 9 protein [Deltaproteobacteria bacterium]